MQKKRCKLTGLLLPVTLTVVGCAGGWLYYRYLGCATGTCAIASNLWLSAGFGGVFGLLLGFILRPDGEDCRTSGGTE